MFCICNRVRPHCYIIFSVDDWVSLGLTGVKKLKVNAINFAPILYCNETFLALISVLN